MYSLIILTPLNRYLCSLVSLFAHQVDILGICVATFVFTCTYTVYGSARHMSMMLGACVLLGTRRNIPGKFVRAATCGGDKALKINVNIL